MSRPTWEEYALNLAYAARIRSPDQHCKVGAVTLRHDHSTASTGYNGAPAGIEIDWSNRDKRRDYVIHAERNACNYIKPGECYILASTLLPCTECLRTIALKRIPTVVYAEDYTTDPEVARKSHEVAKVYGIKLLHLPINYQEENLPKFMWRLFSFLQRCARILERTRRIL